MRDNTTNSMHLKISLPTHNYWSLPNVTFLNLSNELNVSEPFPRMLDKIHFNDLKGSIDLNALNTHII